MTFARRRLRVGTSGLNDIARQFMVRPGLDVGDEWDSEKACPHCGRSGGWGRSRRLGPVSAVAKLSGVSYDTITRRFREEQERFLRQRSKTQNLHPS